MYKCIQCIQRAVCIKCIERAIKPYSLGFTKDKTVCKDIPIKCNGFVYCYNFSNLNSPWHTVSTG